jgi:hypothetical protein
MKRNKNKNKQLYCVFKNFKHLNDDDIHNSIILITFSYYGFRFFFPVLMKNDFYFSLIYLKDGLFFISNSASKRSIIELTVSQHI